MAKGPDIYPLIPKTNRHVEAGQYWSVPLSDGRFACVRVLGVDRSASYGARTNFVGALLDWVGDAPPTSDSIAGAAMREVGSTHVKAVADSKGAILGTRPLDLDGLSLPSKITSYWGTNYAMVRAEYLFVKGDPPPRHERRDVASPLTDEMLAPFKSPTGTVQFKSLLTEPDFQRLGEWLAPQPHVELRAYGSYDRTITDLEFLRHFPRLTQFSADALYSSLVSLDGLRHLSGDTESLGIGQTKKRLDLSVLARFGGLRSLYIEGQTKSIEVIAGLTSLQELTLRSISLPGLELLRPLSNLEALDLKLGGTSDLSALPSLSGLRYLELWMVKGLNDLGPIAELGELRYLFLQSLRQVTKLPDLSRAGRLRRVHLETMKGLRDLRPLVDAPALEQLALISMPHLDVTDLECLVGHPTLNAVRIGLGSMRKNERAEALLGLPDSPGPASWRDI